MRPPRLRHLAVHGVSWSGEGQAAPVAIPGAWCIPSRRVFSCAHLRDIRVRPPCTMGGLYVQSDTTDLDRSIGVCVVCCGYDVYFFVSFSPRSRGRA
jgi:hypothetical protein